MPGIYSEDLAYIHHRGFAAPSIAGAKAVVDRLSRTGVTSGTIVDLGCGSGAAARVFLDAGFPVVGADPSPHMIDLARQVAPEAELAIADADAFEIPPAVVVTAFGEVLAYLREPGRGDLQRVIPRVAAALENGGLFVFDFIEPGASLEGSRWAAGEDWAVRSVTTEEASGRAIGREITTFRRADYPAADLAWMSAERHALAVWGHDEVTALLTDAGFDVELEHAYGDHRLPERRVAAFATRRTRAPDGT